MSFSKSILINSVVALSLSASIGFSVAAQTELQKKMTPLNQIAQLSIQYHKDCTRLYTVKYAHHRLKQNTPLTQEHRATIKATSESEEKRKVHQEAFVKSCIKQAISNDDIYLALLQIKDRNDAEDSQYETSQW